MIEEVKVNHIRPNPFQSRKHIDPVTVKQLADDIDEVGFIGVLTGRRINGHVEISAGHRRLEALKLLKRHTIAVDIIDLDDDQMAMYSLIENLQREGLNDMDKAEGIKQLVERMRQKSGEKNAVQQVAKLLGFGSSYIYDLMHITTFDESAKQVIRGGKVRGKSAMVAHRLGGSSMVKTAAEKNINSHTLQAMSTKLMAIEEKSIREKVRREVITGKITTPERVDRRARHLRAKQHRKTNPKQPPDLIEVAMHWTGAFKEWSKLLSEVEPYLDYIDNAPTVAEKFRVAAQDLITHLEKVCAPR